MNVKKGRPASLTPSLLARKGEAQPARLADGSAPRDVMALHEEIVARLADEITQEGQDLSGLQMGLTPVGGPVAQEPRFDFVDEPEIDEPGIEDAAPQAHAPQSQSFAEETAPYYQSPVLKDTPLTDDTDFDYEAADDEAAVQPDLGDLRPSDMRSYASQPDTTAIAAREVHFETPELAAPEPAASRAAPPSAFVTLRAADDEAEPDDETAPLVPQQKVVASLPMAFAVMVAIAIGGGLGLWVAGSLGPKSPRPPEMTTASADAPSAPVAPVVEPVEAPPAPLSVPSAGAVSVAPIAAPAAPHASAPAVAPAPAAIPAPAVAPKVKAPEIKVPEAKTPVAKTPALKTPEVKAPEVKTGAAVTAAALTGAYGVQLISTPKESDATSEWDRISAKNKAALGKLPHEVVRADLGAKGIYYRLQAGNYADAAEAKALCKTLSAAKQSCIVIKR